MQKDPESVVSAFLHRAVALASRDGLPAAGSDEVRLHGPLADDAYISSSRVMVSFRTPTGTPVALLEQLWADGEGTHIVGRSAVAVDPQTGRPHDMGLFYQSGPGDYTSVLSMAEIRLDQIRKQLKREKTGRTRKMNGHVMARLALKDCHYRRLIDCFEQAARVLGVSASAGDLENNRHLFKIHPDSRHAGRQSLPAKNCG